MFGSLSVQIFSSDELSTLLLGGRPSLMACRSLPIPGSQLGLACGTERGCTSRVGDDWGLGFYPPSSLSAGHLMLRKNYLQIGKQQENGLMTCQHHCLICVSLGLSRKRMLRSVRELLRENDSQMEMGRKQDWAERTPDYNVAKSMWESIVKLTHKGIPHWSEALVPLLWSLWLGCWGRARCGAEPKGSDSCKCSGSCLAAE